MKSLFTFITLIFFGNIQAQNNFPKADIIDTGYGDLTVQPIKHGSLVLTYNGKTIYVDPTGGKKAYSGITKPDMILITDIHGDHFNMETIEELDAKNAVIIAPEVVANKLTYTYKQNSIALKNEQGVHRMGLFISAVPMYNLPETEDGRHTKGRGNGYTISIEDFNIYISGDTSAIQEMKMLYGIDLAFVCMNLPYTMDINEASEGVLAFQPKIMYPYHYRGKGMISDTKKFKELVDAENLEIEVRLRDWYMK
ncbi:MBL fold metallo-hydrolase [Tenacibaculum sp. 1_MG-2023]|uniref:MBL fold metallo-hydrolase n=1 Tax=Tenacibaculum sp. 1_MG-2023 TaxID=3062653 RepID=UPI0026E27412|nr:MBL fold metallo-hydrolase [Tenacibaculum sp. 1_MG-2023]MDO6600500.1 MBL fold metallo-hydrolase [Tenacibaculum sp. 1_MG-2023]